jgi:hypothetical protein
MTAWTPHPRRLLLFTLLSAADLLLTVALLQSGGRYYESNPIAAWCLDLFDLAGLALFKCGAVAVVVGLATAVARSRPRTGGWILTVSCTAVAGVVGYSCLLAGLGGGESGHEEIAAARRLDRRLDQQMAVSHRYQVLLDRLCEDYLRHRCTLEEAVEQILQSEKARDDRWLELFRRRYPGYSDRECLAINFVRYTAAAAQAESAADQVARRLEAAYRGMFTAPAPWASQGVCSWLGRPLL